MQSGPSTRRNKKQKSKKAKKEREKRARAWAGTRDSEASSSYRAGKRRKSPSKIQCNDPQKLYYISPRRINKGRGCGIRACEDLSIRMAAPRVILLLVRFRSGLGRSSRGDGRGARAGGRGRAPRSRVPLRSPGQITGGVGVSRCLVSANRQSTMRLCL
jgi:hypothetical protein